MRKQASRQQPALLESARLVLRPPAIDDWPQWARLRHESREFLQPWEPTWPRNALTRGAFTRNIKLQARDREAGTAFSWFLIRRDDDALMGGVAVSDIRRGVASSGTLGYWIGRSYARQGYMSEAVEAVIDHAFEGFGLHRLEAACLPANEASRRLLASRGFSLEGIGRSYLKIDGDWRDHLLFSLVDFEWRSPDPLLGPTPCERESRVLPVVGGMRLSLASQAGARTAAIAACMAEIGKDGPVSATIR